MGKEFLEHITKYTWSILVFIVIITMTSCGFSSNKKTTDLASTFPTELSSPSPKKVEFSIEKDRVDFVAIVINSNSEDRYRNNGASIYDNEGIETVIQTLNSMDVYPKDESYEYYGGKSPNAMISFFDKQEDVIESVNICYDLKLKEFVFRYHDNIYKINSSEIDKFYDICEKYKPLPEVVQTEKSDYKVQTSDKSALQSSIISKETMSKISESINTKLQMSSRAGNEIDELNEMAPVKEVRIIHKDENEYLYCKYKCKEKGNIFVLFRKSNDWWWFDSILSATDESEKMELINKNDLP